MVMKGRGCHLLAIAAALLCLVVQCNTENQVTIRGVPKSALSSYSSQKDKFRCIDGKKEIPFSFINDDYCDCSDGSDEPGTSACSPKGKFWCQNKAHKGAFIPSSRVNDGVCDCCDGSDEYGSSAKCSDRCVELGAAEREKAMRDASLHNQGAELKEKWAEEAKAELQRAAKRLEELRAKVAPLKETVSTLQEQKKVAQQAQQQQREARAKEEADRKAKEDAQKAKEAPATAPEVPDAPISAVDTNAVSDAAASDEKVAEPAPAAAAAVEPAAVRDHAKHVPPAPPAPPEGRPVEGDMAGDAGKDSRDGGMMELDEQLDDEDLDDHHRSHFDDEEPDDVEPVEPEDLQDTSGIATDHDAEVERLRGELREAESKLRDAEEELRKLEALVAHDFGPNKEFHVLHGKCFTLTLPEYTYEFCPYEKTVQRIGAHNTVNLGTYKGWRDGKYRKMWFHNGQQCWGGPGRECEVELVCGSQHELKSASEPNRCVYAMVFETPTVCSRDHATILTLNMDDHGEH